MADEQNVALKISVLNDQRDFLGETVDILLENRRLPSDRRQFSNVDTSDEIEIRGLGRELEGFYTVTVKFSDTFDRQSQFVKIPASGFATLEFAFDLTEDQGPALKIRILDAQRNFLGGLADIRLEHMRLASELRELKDVDVSQEVAVTGLKRAPEGFYKVIVRLSDPFQQQGQFVNIPASGSAMLEFVFDREAAPDGELEVRGVVRFLNGLAASSFAVQAFDRDLRSEEPLGGALTDRNGAYRIGYSVNQIRKKERGGADLVVKAFGADGEELVASPVMFNAPPQAEIDLTIPLGQGPALFDRIANAVAPLLGDVAIEELEENQEHQDLTFLSGETGFGMSDLARFVLAHHLVQLGVQTDFWFALLGNSFFQYSETRSLEDHRTMVTAALVGLDAQAVRKALDLAFAIQDIAAILADKTDEWIEAFLELISGLSLGNPDQPTFLKEALDDAGIGDADRQKTFARLFNKYRAMTPQLLAELEEDPAFEESEVADLRTSYQLSDLTRGDFSVVRALKTDFSVRRPEQIRTLAKRSEGQWIDWTQSKHQAGDIELPLRFSRELPETLPVSEPELYGRTLERQLREAFPTAAFTGGLERALSADGPRGLQRGQEMASFLDSHPNFELHRTRVDTFLDNGVQAAVAGLAQDREFRLELKATQRVFKLAPTFEATDTLRADGLHSAQGVYRMGETKFVQRYSQQSGFTVDSARRSWARAADTHAATLTIVGDLKALEAEALPAALKSNAEGLPAVSKGSSEALADFPNWENLFRGGDICHCEHCRSVLGPAAYFVDLLMFLRDRNVKDVLFKRRPDLGYLELNCENAHTTLPYVDVVCEVLERAIAGAGQITELNGFATMPADLGQAQTAVMTALDAEGLELVSSPELGVTFNKLENPDRWVVHGDAASYLIRKNGTANFFAEVLPNSKASSAELRAYPGYVNPAAYVKLEEAQFPFSLPFNLFAEEVRAGFRKSNIQRWDLMRTLRGPNDPNDPMDGDVAAEYFGISSDPKSDFDEKQLILEAALTNREQGMIWGGVVLPGWLNELSVETFQGKAGLEYEELLALLDLSFINPSGEIFIEHLDSSCDTRQKRIRGLNAGRLDRIHRFLRLWRKLDGWEMWELDLVIRHPAIGDGSLDEDFLVALYFFNRLRNRLGSKVTVEEVCALLGDLNTETHFVAAHEKRGDGLYQSLFLNRRLIQPLDPAFEIDAVDAPGPTTEKLWGHKPVILAALRVRETDLYLLTALTRPPEDQAYITDDLTLANLSFLWRHAWLSKVLKLKAVEWKTLLKLLQQDVASFADPEQALKFVEVVDHLKASGLTPDDLDWILAANRSAKAAVKEADAARFLTALRTELAAIRAEYDPARYEFLEPPSDEEQLTGLLTSLLQQLHRDEAGARFFLDVLRDEVVVEQPVEGLPADFDFPEDIRQNIPIRYDDSTTPPTLRFTGMMTDTERSDLTDPSLGPVTEIAAYEEAIEELFQQPRLALKFLEPVFTATLSSLPAELDLDALADPALRSKIAYDSEVRALRMVGILSRAERVALDDLSADTEYRSAVDSLFSQPRTGTFGPEELWLQEDDLDFPLRDLGDPDQDNLKDNLATAIQRALPHLSKTLSEDLVILQASSRLGLTEELTRRLLTRYSILPETLLEHLTVNFAASRGVVDFTNLESTFQGWYWAHRTATAWKHWQLTPPDLERLDDLTAGAQLLDFASLPMNETAAPASLERFLRTDRLLRIRQRLPESNITLIEVLQKLDSGVYAAEAEFAVDVERMNEAWSEADVLTLVSSLDLVWPEDSEETNPYLLAESWERLHEAFSFLERLNAGASTVLPFAAAAMTETHAKTLKELLRSRFGAESWLTLSAEIQDVLRERKRDALASYLLSQPKPSDAPSGKWENTNDLYAYYLLDVEMSACQLTSRLVQASGSVQLFVQRCFMGLEPDVTVQADGEDGDSAWRWWKWMRKYRVWEANRKVFLWPENWIEPELKKDRSYLFKDLENELLQNEINEHTVETAFANYLEKLDGIAQLEVAGFYQEDDGDNTILHVFGRTTGAEPHLYYYRRYDYRQWTPWEKVELDIQGDYLIPAVVGGRLYLFWPVFTEVPDEDKNKTVSTPDANQRNVPIEKAWKKLRLQMAVSDYRQGRWVPRRISKQFVESDPYDVEITRSHYTFIPTATNDVLVIEFEGHSLVGHPLQENRQGEAQPPRYTAHLEGSFEITGCTGVPEDASREPSGRFIHAVRPSPASTGFHPTFLKWEERRVHLGSLGNDLVLINGLSDWLGRPPVTPVLGFNPLRFRISPPWHLSYLDRLFSDGISFLLNLNFQDFNQRLPGLPILGTWLPFFYRDKERNFFILPSLWAGFEDGQLANWGKFRSYYPEIKGTARNQIQSFEEALRDELADWQPTPQERAIIAAYIVFLFPDLVNSPIDDDEELKELIVQIAMGFVTFLLGLGSFLLFQIRQFHFKNFYHPFVCDFAKLIHNPLKGIPGLMKRETQLKNSGFSFSRNYRPGISVVDPTTEDHYPKEIVDFSPDGAYSSYNWELFFHAPLLIANALSTNQRFEEARDWYHYIFNPLGIEEQGGGSPMSKYWITKPFFETTSDQHLEQRIENLLSILAGEGEVGELESQVEDWRTNPFEPHRIANYRTVAYQKTVVMKYLDNLIAWGDFLFRQDSMESINEATQLYILAAEILGPRPKRIPPQTKPPLESFNELEAELDDFGNAPLVEVENLVPVQTGAGGAGLDQPPLPFLYFCIPHNEKMLGYWDTVADRLFKIRHCMNIEGVVRQLALFEPPIDPAALVKAVAGGLDIGAALADLNAPLPLYRFNVLVQLANQVCNDVKALGSALLSALEKKDAEALALLRQGQEIQVLEAVKAVREKQIEEAEENKNGLDRAKELADIKKIYYQEQEFMNAGEIVALTISGTSALISTGVAFGYILSGGLKAVPQFLIGAAGFGGSPHATAETGGRTFGEIAEDSAQTLSAISTALDKGASIASTVAGYQRRQDEWDFQKDLAEKELEQIDAQIEAAKLRTEIANDELENHIKQRDNAKAIDEFLRLRKYTNENLYLWQVGKISGVYFQSYRLAYDLAKRAERCFRFELGLKDSDFIQFGHWDSLKKGLLSAEKLQHDLRRLEAAYLEQNRRELELTKHISLRLLDPLAMVRLRETGRCFFTLPEEIFDLDYPGHYFRRIKSVRLTVPSVTGPYTTISCTLRLLKNSIRTSTAKGTDGYPRNTDEEDLPLGDERFVENNIPVKAIAISSGQNDGGVFELNFRDERYLPFEGAGVVSDWALELFNDPSNPDFGRSLRQFDYNSISDIVLHVSYTAREDAGVFKNDAIQHLRDYFSPRDETAPAFLMLDLRRDFPTQWSRFIHPADPTEGNVLELEMSHQLFPFRDAGKTLKVDTIYLLARSSEAENYDVTLTPQPPEPELPPDWEVAMTLARADEYGGLHFGQKAVTDKGIEIMPNAKEVRWRLEVTGPTAGSQSMEDLVFVLGYQWEK